MIPLHTTMLDVTVRHLLVERGHTMKDLALAADKRYLNLAYTMLHRKTNTFSAKELKAIRDLTGLRTDEVFILAGQEAYATAKKD